MTVTGIETVGRYNTYYDSGAVNGGLAYGIAGVNGASGNTVYLANSTVNSAAYGGYMYAENRGDLATDADTNTAAVTLPITVNSADSEITVTTPLAVSAGVNNNALHVIKSTLTGGSAGGMMNADDLTDLSGNTVVSVNDNSITLSDGSTASSYLYGGYLTTESIADLSCKAEASLDGNSIDLTGKSSVSRNMFGAYLETDSITDLSGEAKVSVNDNSITFDDGSTASSYLYGGYLTTDSIADISETSGISVNGNHVSVQDSTIKSAVISNRIYVNGGYLYAGDITGLSSENVTVSDNSVTAVNSTLGATVYGGYFETTEHEKGADDTASADAISVSGNKVTLLDTYVDGDNVYGGYGVIDNNSKADSVVLSPVNVNNNTVDISFDTLMDTMALYYVYGGDTSLGNADNNSVSISGIQAENGSNILTIYHNVIGGNSSYGYYGGNAEGNKVSLKNADFYQAVYGGKVGTDFVADPDKGLAGISGVSGNTVDISDSVFKGFADNNYVYGGYLRVGSLPDGGTAEETEDGIKVTYTSGNKTISYILPKASSPGVNHNTVTLTNLKNESNVGLNVYGGKEEYVSGEEVFDSVTANDNKVTISSTLDQASVYGDVYGGAVAEGDVDRNIVSITGEWLSQEEGPASNITVTDVIGGSAGYKETLQERCLLGNAGGNTVTLENVQAETVYGGKAQGTFVNGASGNKVTMVNSTASASLFGGYLSLSDWLYWPTISDSDGAQSVTYEEDYYGAYTTYTHTVESAASAGANNNIAGVSYDLETTADYREAVGGFAEIGSANGNTLVMEGRQLDDGTNMTIDAGDYSDENLVLVPDMDVAAAGGAAYMGTANENTLALTNTTLKNNVAGGLVGITLAADDDEWYYKTYELFTVDTVQANENKTLLTDVLTEGSSISVYGGYVAPTTATVLTPVQEDDEWVLQARENASANENILQIVQTVDKDASYKDVLGGTTLYGEANGNQVIIQGTEKEKITAAHVAGGYTGGTHADSNTVSLANAEVTGSIIDGTTVLSTQKTVYGYDDDGDVTSTTPYTSALSFAAEGDQSAKGNTVSLANVSGGLVLGGMVMQGAAKGNTVTISGSTAENVYGGAAGILGTDSASIRSALKSSLPVLEYDEKNNDYYGAEIDPEVGYISGTTFENIAVVPNAEESAISASGNTVNMVSGTVESIYGGYAADFLMDEAAAEPTEEEAAYGIMSDEEDEGTTYESGAASDNTVNYYGGTVSQNIISGYSQSGEANNNTVNLYSGMLSLLGNLYGRYSESGSEGSGNTLNVYTKGNSTGNLDHFQSLNFYVPKETTAGETMLTVTGQADVSGAVITADPSGIESLKPGETVGLIHGDNDITAENTTYGLIGDNHITDENFISYTMDIAKQDSNNIVIYIPENSKGVINPDTKLLPESREAATAALKNSASIVTDSAFGAAASAWDESGNGCTQFMPYAVVGGSDMRYETGSHVSVTGLAANVGFVKREKKDGRTDTVMPFFEYGRSNYASHLDNGARGDGKQHYTGAGILFRRDQAGGLYYEAAASAGYMKGDFHGRIGSMNARYESGTPYISAQAGLGKVYTRNRDTYDIYGKFFWSHLASDSASVVNQKGTTQYDFDSVNSYVTRLGMRWTRNFDQVRSLYAGIGWDYKFDNEARASYKAYSTPSPSMKGSSGFFELGWKSKIDDSHPWGVDVKATGWAGKEKGATYYVGIGHKF